MSEKMWGSEPFWGLGYEWDPNWVLTDRQQELRATIIELCETELRANAKRFDDELTFPRRNLELLGEHGFLALTVPEEYGGLGENHVAYSMVCETIARYGCASTAMCYVMHMGAVNAIMLRQTPELIDKYIRPLNSGKLGTLSYSDPETGSHFWYPDLVGRDAFQRRLQGSQEGFVDHVGRVRRLLRRADDEPRLHRVRRPLGLRGRRRPREVAAVAVGRARACGATSLGRSRSTASRCRPPSSSVRPATAPSRTTKSVDPWFLIGSSSVWNGLALGAIDIAKRHTTRKRHVDVGLRVADYPTIQDYVGEAVMDTNACRVFSLSVAQAMDGATENNTKNPGPGELARGNFLHWAWQIKFEAAKNVAHVVDKMLHACGGSGYKRDMELERYLRDAKAGWVMGPDQRGASPVRRQGGAARLRIARLLEPVVQPPGRRERGEEARRRRQARARDAAHVAGRRGSSRRNP